MFQPVLFGVAPMTAVSGMLIGNTNTMFPSFMQPTQQQAPPANIVREPDCGFREVVRQLNELNAALENRLEHVNDREYTFISSTAGKIQRITDLVEVNCGHPHQSTLHCSKRRRNRSNNRNRNNRRKRRSIRAQEQTRLNIDSKKNCSVNSSPQFCSEITVKSENNTFSDMI
ncbi:hypothetical protein HA402_014829 [Bradysia odoriphaga]|nr:hypothetical protein HA402_014829 [Bradysia odoriphaga]